MVAAHGQHPGQLLLLVTAAAEDLSRIVHHVHPGK